MTDFDDFDDLDFKPVTKGLGFHHDESREKKTYVRATPKNVNPVMPSDSQVSKVDLSMFYGKDQNIETVESTPISALRDQAEVIRPIKDAEISKRATAFIIDVLCIAFLSAVTIFGFITILGGDVDVIADKLPTLDIVLICVFTFVLYYLSYFTILDSQSTIGKTIAKIKIEYEDRDDKLSFTTAFARAFISLLVITIFVDLHSKLTNTVVVKL